MKTEYHHIENGYTMKVRIYPNKTAQAIIDGYFTALEKAANITLWELKQHNPMITRPDKKDESVLWPDFGKMAKKEWLDVLREKNELIANTPGGALSSSVGGLFLCDMKKAWEKQGKLPVDAWFDRKDKKGHNVLHFYGRNKKKSSYFLQIDAGKFVCDEAGRIYVTPTQALGRMRVRGWYENITFGDKGLSFFEYYDPHKRLSCHISKNTIGEYYLTVVLQDVNRRYRVADKREPIGIDLNVTQETGVVSSGKRIYENRKFKQQVQSRDDELHRKLSRRYGIANAQYRDDCREVRRGNKNLPYEERKPLPEPSKRYKKADRLQKKLSLKIQRRRDYYQHQIAATEVSNVSLVGVESLNVKGMLRNNNLSSSLSDAAFSSQIEKIRYKSAWADIPVIEVGKWFPSSHVCPDCGHKFDGDEKFGLEVREWKCPDCGSVWGRDEAAAENIKREAIRIFENPDDFLPGETKKEKKIPKDKILDKNHPDILIHYDENMRNEYKNPYVVINTDGEILDDAQGYGYDTAQKAQKAYRHKYLKAA